MKYITGFIFCLCAFVACELMEPPKSPPSSEVPLSIIPPEMSPEDVLGYDARQKQLGFIHQETKPLRTGEYTVAFKDCSYDRVKFTMNILQFYETFTDSVTFVAWPGSWEDANVRYICSDKYGWVSYSGTDIFLLPKNQWTTSLGKEYNPTYVLYATMHESWGHLINGADHEQHNYIGGGMNWNMPKLYAYFNKLYGWSPERVDKWVNRQKELHLVGSDFDPDSFMLYVYDCGLTLDSVGCGTFNYVPSPTDIKYMQKNHGNGVK